MQWKIQLRQSNRRGNLYPRGGSESCKGLAKFLRNLQVFVSGRCRLQTSKQGFVSRPWPKWLHRHSQHQGKQIQWRPSWLQKQFMPPWSRWLNRSLTFDEMWQKPWGMTVLGQEKLRDQFLIINWTDRLYECPRVRSCVKLSFLSRYSRLGFEKKRTHDKAVQQPDETDMCGCKRSQTSYIYIGAEWKWMCRYGVNVWLCLTFWQTDTERYVRCPDPYWLHSFNVTRPISSHGICLESRIISVSTFI